MGKKFSFDEIGAHLWRGDVIRWQSVLDTVARAIEDTGHPLLSFPLYRISREFDALLTVGTEEEED